MVASIEMENVTTFYDGEKNSTLKEISLRIEQGEFVCIMGPNGAGKTTLLETANGMLPCQGKIRVLGSGLNGSSHRVRRRIGYMLQAKAFPEQTPYLVKDVIIMGRFGKIGILRRPSRSDREAARQAAEYFSVDHLWERPIGRLSGGQTQRVLLARMLAKDPEVLLLDEPYVNLDYRSVDEVAFKICALHQNAGLTSLMVVHDLAHVPDICDRIILLKDGRMIGEAPPKEMLSSPQFAAAFSDR